MVAVGEGRSMLAEYDFDLRLLREYRGFDHPTDVSVLADRTLVVTDNAAQQLVLIDPDDGNVRGRQTISPAPLQARPRRGGGLLVVAPDDVVALDPSGREEWRVRVPRIRAGAPLPNGNVLVAVNDVYGRLIEMTPSGQVMWQSPPPGHNDASGRWVPAPKDRFYSSMCCVDVAADGKILSADAGSSELRVLSPTYDPLRTVTGIGHLHDARIGARGELVSASQEEFRVWLELPGGQAKILQTSLRPQCANTTPWGTLLVCLYLEPERQVLNATRRRQHPPDPTPWWQWAVPVPLIGVILALGVAGIARRRATDGGAPPVVRSEAVSDAVARRKGAMTSAAMILAALGVAGGFYLSWLGIETIQSAGFVREGWRFAAGCLLSGVSLRLLNAFAGSAASLSSFVPPVRVPAPAPRDRRTIGLAIAAFVCIGACIAVLVLQPAEQALAVALWLVAQIWIVAAVWPPAVPRDETAGTVTKWALGAILLFTVVSRFWRIGYMPDQLHHDHDLYGLAILHPLRGDWKPFFIMDHWSGSTYSRPWLGPAIGAMALFGAEFWVLRFPAAVWAVVMVWAAYLLASVLFNRRVGLIAALLTSVNHILLTYSRQPYVIESVPPLLLALSCAVIGMRRGGRFHWCVAGMLCGWSMLSVRQATMYPFIGGAFFVYLALLHPRWLWQNRYGLLWLIAGAAIVYLPMVPRMVQDATLVNRLDAAIAVANPDGSIRWDSAVWGYQLGRSFGSILYYADTAPWGVGTGGAICMGIEACLFGAGLVYLLLWWKSPAGFFAMSMIVITIFLGSALLISPPTHYHFLVGVVAMMFVSAVACDRLLAPLDRWSAPWRTLAAAAMTALLLWIGYANLADIWKWVRRPAAAADGSVVYRAQPAHLVARWIRSHPQFRFYMVRTPRDLSCADPILRFAARDSDISDISTDLRDTLPVPPVDAAEAGVAFVVLLTRSADREQISAVYPGAKIDKIHSFASQEPLWFYTVGADEVREAWENKNR